MRGNTAALLQNMIDQISEAQIKLGYARETIRLYFPAASLRSLLEMPSEGGNTGFLPEGPAEDTTLQEPLREDISLQELSREDISLRELPRKDTDADDLLDYLQKEPSLCSGVLGDLQFRRRGSRFEVSVPPEGSEYVFRNVRPSDFLTDLIGLFREHHSCTTEQIRSVFEKYSTDVCCEQMPEGSDFDYVLYFRDGRIDPYYYCIHQEMGHTIYHRFLKEDWKQLMTTA